jgi:hypothetical protein
LGGALADANGTSSLRECFFLGNQALGATKVAKLLGDYRSQQDDDTSGSGNGGAILMADN